MSQDSILSGRVQKAPENFLSRTGIKEVFAEGKKGRRDFIRNAFAAAAASVAAPVALAQGNPVPSEGGDTNILNLPERRLNLLQDFTLGTDGALNRNPTLRNLDRGYELMPRFAKQVGARQVLLPCIYRNYLCFAKIDYTP